MDWKLAANLMAKVYGSAACTIAAIGPNGDIGCFRRRNPLLRRPGKLIETSGTSVYAYGFFLSPNDYNILEDAEVPGIGNFPFFDEPGSSRNV